MARISEKNQRFRTKAQISTDLAFIINAPLTYGTKFAVISEVTWVWSEYYGKYHGCKYWTENALKAKDDLKSLIHEHLVPKKILIKHLINLKSPQSNEIYNFLEKYCIGVVVTKEEDKKINEAGLKSTMPENWDNVDPWSRYEACDISPIKQQS